MALIQGGWKQESQEASALELFREINVIVLQRRTNQMQHE